MPRYVLVCLVALALLPAPARAQDLAAGPDPALRRQQPNWPPTSRARQNDGTRGITGISLGMMLSPSYEVYRGSVGLYRDSVRYGASYRERTDPSRGFMASLHWSTRTAGDMIFTVYHTEGLSTGHYSGLAAPETLERGFRTTGFELGWRLAFVSGRVAALRLQFGPSITLHRLNLSDGHRDWHAAPGSESRPDIQWSDRSWLALGGFVGPHLAVYLGRHFGVWGSATGRFYMPDQKAWASQEERDIVEQTGRSVKITYERLLAFSGSLAFGFELRL